MRHTVCPDGRTTTVLPAAPTSSRESMCHALPQTGAASSTDGAGAEMTGSIRRRGKMTWELTFDLGRDPVTDERQRQSMSFQGTRREAEKALAEAIHRRNTGLDIARGQLTVSE